MSRMGEQDIVISKNGKGPVPLPALLALVTSCLEDHKAEDIVTINLAGRCSFADSMVIATGTSHRHVSALADHLCQALKAVGVPRLAVEGLTQGDWVLVDAGDVVIHLFRAEVRSFYALEKMWSDQPAQVEMTA